MKLKSKRPSLLKVAGLIGLAGMIFFSAGCHFKGSPEKKARWMVKKLTKKLDLTASQQKKLNAMKEEFLAEVKKHPRRGPGKFHGVLLKEIKKDKINRSLLEDHFEKRQKSKAQMQKFMLNKFIEFHAILTPEQREKLAELADRMHERRKRHRKHKRRRHRRDRDDDRRGPPPGGPDDD